MPRARGDYPGVVVVVVVGIVVVVVVAAAGIPLTSITTESVVIA